MVSSEHILVVGQRYGRKSGKRGETHLAQGFVGEHVGRCMIHSSPVMVVKGEILVAAVILSMVLFVRVVQRDERCEVEILGIGLMLQVMHEENREPHQVRADQEPLHPKDGQQEPDAGLHRAKVAGTSVACVMKVISALWVRVKL